MDILTENYKLYLGNCLEIMDRLIKMGIKVDCIITDLPYGTTKCRWDSVIPFNEMWERLNKLIKSNGAIALFGIEPFSSQLRCSNIKDYRYDWYWKKSKSGNFLQANRQPHKKIELISVFYKKQCLYNPQKIDNPKGEEKRYKSPVVNHKKVHDEQVSNANKTNKYSKKYESDKLLPICLLEFNNVNKPIHPTQKPVDLLEYLVKTYTNENEIVLDFTMGSGSTGVACMNTNRRFIGIELEEKYFNISINRIFENYNN